MEALGSGGEAGRYVSSGARPRRPRRDGDGDAAEPQSPSESAGPRTSFTHTHTLRVRRDLVGLEEAGRKVTGPAETVPD